MNCLKCGNAILEDGYCSVCGLEHAFVKKAYNTSEYYYNIGLDRVKVRDLTGAIDALSLSLKYNKKNINARNLLGLIYYEMSEVVLALSHWVVSANYDNTKNNRALHYIRDIQSSPAKLDSISQLAAKYNQTLIYASQGSKDLALIQLKKILSSHPHFVKGYLLLALLYIDDENYDKAKKALKRVLRIDKTNTMAIRYMKEIGISEKEIMGFRDEDEFFEEPADYDGEEEYTHRNTRTTENIGDIIEGRDDGETSFKVGNYKEVNNSKYSLVYVGFGLILGIVAMMFLVMPNKITAIRNEYKDIKVSYSDEISKKNVTIEDLQSQVSDLKEENEDLKQKTEEISNTSGTNTNYDKLIVASQLYADKKYYDAVKNIYQIDKEAFSSEASRSLYNDIMKAGKKHEFKSTMKSAEKAYEAGNYKQAIEEYGMCYAMDKDSDKALYRLAKAYKKNGDEEKYQDCFSELSMKFPESEYIQDTGIED